MDFLTVIGTAIGLAMDAFSVCIAAGCTIKKPTYRHYFRLAFHFGLFQFFMPILGYYGGILIEEMICCYDHWIAMALLSFIGGKMIWESFKKEDRNNDDKDPSRGITLIMLSIATSIDAAAVGFSLAALKSPVIIPAIFIGLICILFSVIGVFLGDKIGSKLGVWAERIGGTILIVIGLKILIEHMF
ncbi:MAG: manganese efflux pump [Spirochaetales bacterium]|nr:manganese efflux pump [Spirochaetales bacterium]